GRCAVSNSISAALSLFQSRQKIHPLLSGRSATTPLWPKGYPGFTGRILKRLVTTLPCGRPPKKTSEVRLRAMEYPKPGIGMKLSRETSSYRSSILNACGCSVCSRAKRGGPYAPQCCDQHQVNPPVSVCKIDSSHRRSLCGSQVSRRVITASDERYSLSLIVW